jgi:hypothetical protein
LRVEHCPHSIPCLTPVPSNDLGIQSWGGDLGSCPLSFPSYLTWETDWLQVPPFCKGAGQMLG